MNNELIKIEMKLAILEYELRQLKTIIKILNFITAVLAFTLLFIFLK